MHQDGAAVARACDGCQRNANIAHQPPEQLTTISSPWPFAQWGLDLIGPMPTGRGQAKYAIVAIDYFTKWVEAEPLSTITERKATDFVKRNIVCRFGIPKAIITDNGKQFDSAGFRKLCEDLQISLKFASPAHPKSNGLVEAANKTIKNNLKARLGSHKGLWVEELPEVLWAHRTTFKDSTGETPFSLAYGCEAVIPAEIGVTSHRVQHYEEGPNEDLLKHSLDLIEEKRERSALRLAACQQRMARFYDKRVRVRTFRPGDLVLRRVTLNTKKLEHGSLGAKWEGPYKVSKVIRSGAYHLENLDGVPIPRPWNAEMLRRYYQ